MAEQLLRAGTQRSPRLPQPWGNFLLAGCGFPHPPPGSSQVMGLSEGVCVCFSMGSIRRKYPSSPETRGIPE